MKNMNKNDFALTPPMGWNSYDYYDTTVTEEKGSLSVHSFWGFGDGSMGAAAAKS